MRGMFGTILGRREPQLLQDVDWARDPFFRETLSEYTSVIAIPLTGDRLPMTWAIGLKKAPKQFTVSDLEETVERAAMVGALLENQILAGELAHAHQQIDRDARQVGELQRALLRHLCHESPDWKSRRVTSHWAARAAISTTSFLSMNIPRIQAHAGATPSRWCVCIGDIEGRGLAAALVMAIVQAVLHVHSAGIATPAGLLIYGNRRLYSSRIDGLVTASFRVYGLASRRLTYAGPGIRPPVAQGVQRMGRSARWMASGATRWELMRQRRSKKPPCSLSEATFFCSTPMALLRRRARRKTSSALTGSCARSAMEAIDPRNSLTGCARPCGHRARRSRRR